ncbi:MAG: class I SAM-dependent methyltransferase [Bacteroidetes bacterium]|nr:class I SAM-dependent methyltransferase [Bacteroidota bacterium]
MANTEFKSHEDKTVTLYDEAYSAKYRAYDEEFMNAPTYQHYKNKLEGLTKSFTKPISALDVGCGSGRYFHLIKNAHKLTGIDVAAPMLEMAKHPVKESEVNIPEIKLIHGNVFDYDFGNEKFDFIYSVGVLGEHAPFDLGMVNHLYNLLNINGILFTTIVNLDIRKNTKRKLAEAAYPLMPGSLKRVFDQRWKSNYMTHKQLDALMKQSLFTNYKIDNHVSDDGVWKGGHYEVTGKKG